MAVTMNTSQCAWLGMFSPEAERPGGASRAVCKHFSVLSRGLQLTFSCISDKARLAQGHLLSWEPSKDQSAVPLPFEPMFWKAFWESQEKRKPPIRAPQLFPEKKCLQKQEEAGPRSYAFLGGGKERDQCLGSWGMLSKNISSLSST